ncbi:MAG TPA: hypothetical protein VN684_07570 [Terriglobales bacterium]|nr:hypothetical protein [Terriglobales bacterium]
MPSITDMIFMLLLLAMTCGALAPRMLGDADIGWHIRNGELILRTHSITRLDPFSSSMQGKPWYSWEWLYDVGIGAIHEWAGLNAVVFASAVVIAFTFAFLFRLSLARGGNVIASFIFLILTFAAAAIHLFARPHIQSWLLLIVWFQILDSAQPQELSSIATVATRNRTRLFYLPLLMLFWVNVHGEFLLGFVLLGIYLISGIIQRVLASAESATARREISSWLQRLAAVTVVSFLVTFINPYGYRLHLHIYSYLSNRWLIDHIEEFQSPNFHGWAQQAFVLLVLLAIVTLAAAPKKLDLARILVLLFAVYSGFYAARDLPTSCMLLTLILAPVFSQVVTLNRLAASSLAAKISAFLIRSRSFTERMGAFEFRLRWHLWPAIAVLCGVVLCAHAGGFGSSQLMDAHFDSSRFPVESSNFIANQKISGPVFAPDSWGGYLIYRLAPATRVFVDDRHDLYGDKFLQDYVKVVSVSPEWQTILEREHLHWVLAPRGSTLANILGQTASWKLVHEDQASLLFEQK